MTEIFTGTFELGFDSEGTGYFLRPYLGEGHYGAGSIWIYNQSHPQLKKEKIEKFFNVTYSLAGTHVLKPYKIHGMEEIKKPIVAPKPSNYMPSFCDF